MNTTEIGLNGSASVNVIGKVTCRPGDCSRIIEGIKKEDLTVHPDGRVTLLSHEKAQEKIAEYQEILKERPDCSEVDFWKFDIKEKIVDKFVSGLIKVIERLYGKAVARASGYLISTTVEGKEKAVERVTEDTFEELAPEEVTKIIRKGNLVMLAYDIAHKAFKVRDAIWEHDRRCSYFRSIEGMITQASEASTVPIAWIEPRKKTNQYREPEEDHPENLQVKKENREIPDYPTSEIEEEEKVEIDTISKSRNENLDVMDGPVFTVIHLDTRQFKKSNMGLEIDLEGGCSAGAALHPMKLKRSALLLNSNITEELGTSITLSPAKLEKSTVGATFGDGSLNVGMSSSLDGKHSQVKIGGKIEGVDAAISFDARRPLKGVIHLESSQKISDIPCSFSTDLNLHNPLKTTVAGEAVIPVYGVPLKIGGKIKLGKPQDAQFKVSLPTGFFDKVLPKEVKLGDVQILSLNLKKFRGGLKKVTGIGGSKKKKALKRVQKQVAAIEAEQERIRKMREQWFRELTDWVVQKVDEEYAPILSKEIRDLNHDLKQFIEGVSEFPVLNLQEIERQSLSFNPDKLKWYETEWEEFFTNAAGALFEMNEENKAISQLVLQMEELSNSLTDCVAKCDQISEQYQYVKETYKETERLMQILANNKQASARLRDSVSPAVLVKSTAELKKE